MNVDKMTRTKVESSLKTSIVNLIDGDYTMINGDKNKQMFAEDVVNLVREEFRELDSVETSQILWIGIHKDDKPSYSKNAGNIQVVPISLSLIEKEDLDMIAEGYSKQEIREKIIVTLFKEAYQQSALLSNIDIAMMIGVSPTTVSKQAR